MSRNGPSLLVAGARNRLPANTAGGPPKTLVAAIKTRESQLERLRSGLAQLAGRTRVGRLDQQRYRETVLKRLCDWQSLVGRHVADARRILRSLLEGRIAFTPRSAGDETWYEFAGQASLARVLTGVVSTKGLVAPTGFEPVFTVRHALAVTHCGLRKC